MDIPRMQRGRATLRNALGRRQLERISEANIYAPTYAAYHAATLERGASLQDAAQRIYDRVETLAERGENFYDLVVLDKDGARVRVRDRRGQEHDLLDLVTNSYNDLEHFPETRAALVDLVSTIPLSSCISRKIAGMHCSHHELAA